ncbi:MAG: class I SAM-dependent methyltransferase [Candidatus Sulfotelmatobacter sp.]
MKNRLQKLNAAIKDRALHLAGLELKIEYITTPPSAQNALDIFKGEWYAKLPPPFENLMAGAGAIFEDPRIIWLGQRLDKPESLHVLECGPHEGAHTYMLEKFGVASILSIEANTHAFLRCLVLKELLELKRARFMLGDFVGYLRTGERYDLVVASGVLYHLLNPVEAIALIAKVTDQVYIWSHYYDEQKVRAQPMLAHHFRSSLPSEYAGFQHSLHRQRYQTRLGNAGFNGGSSPYSHWLSREDLIGSLKFFGFNDIAIHFDHPDDSAGPNISLMAKRTIGVQ